MKNLLFRFSVVIIAVLTFYVILKRWTITIESTTKTHTFDNFDYVNGTTYSIVPNIVHYVIFERNEISFITYLSILSVLKNQNPQNVVIHSNVRNFVGSYWERISKDRRYNTKVSLLFMPRPTHVYGRMLSSVYHSTDVARISVLTHFGGIYLDTDVLVLKSLNVFRHFEMTLGWPENQYIGTQVLIGNKNARFLKLWLESYQFYYPTGWYYNAGQLPTDDILEKQPYLVHRVKRYFGVQNLIEKLYSERPWPEWKKYYTIHLLSRHNGAPVHVNESSLHQMKTPFAKIARSILAE